MHRDQDLADNVRNTWFSDPDMRAKWRRYMRENEKANDDYRRRNGIVGKGEAPTPWAPDLQAHVAQRRARGAATRRLINQRQPGRES